MTGVIATALVAHVPTLGQAQNTPDYQQTLVQAERKLGAAMRAALGADRLRGCPSGASGHSPPDSPPAGARSRLIFRPMGRLSGQAPI